MSVWRRQRNLINLPPISLNLEIIQDIWGVERMRGLNRRRPYPPSFKRIAAKTIEPVTGASTCALGSHR